MNFQNQKIKNNYNNSYVLNHNEVYGNCKQTCDKYRPLKTENILAVNTMNNNLLVLDNVSEINKIVYQNIQNGGIICQSEIRTNINSKMCDRYVDEINIIKPPFNYIKNVETESYLLHGKKSNCSRI